MPAYLKIGEFELSDAKCIAEELSALKIDHDLAFDDEDQDIRDLERSVQAHAFLIPMGYSGINTRNRFISLLVSVDSLESAIGSVRRIVRERMGVDTFDSSMSDREVFVTLLKENGIDEPVKMAPFCSIKNDQISLAPDSEKVDVMDGKKVDLDIRNGTTFKELEQQYLAMLDLKPGASIETIQESHRQLCKKFNPVNFAYLGAEFTTVAESRMREIEAAFAWLSKSHAG